LVEGLSPASGAATRREKITKNVTNVLTIVSTKAHTLHGNMHSVAAGAQPAVIRLVDIMRSGS